MGSLKQEDKEKQRAEGRWRLRVSLTDIIDTVIAIALIIGAWEALYLLRVYPQYLFPSPLTTLRTFARLFESGQLPDAIATTGYRLAAGFAVVMLIGLAVGVLMVKFKRFGRTMASFGLGLQSFPSIAWVPFAILVVGLSDFGIIFVMVMSSTFSVMLSTYSGLRNIPPIYLKAARNMGARRFSLLRGVMLPASMPSLITGSRQAWSFSWHALIGAEMLMGTVGLTGSVGLGAILYFGSEFVRMDQIIATMITIFIIGVAVDRVIFYRLERSVRAKWGLTS
jgi:sulfonate transport system permease protein